MSLNIFDWPTPPRPVLLPVKWEHKVGTYYDDEGANALPKNFEQLKVHIKVLDDQIKEMETAIDR